jgi:CHAD domain-containing protein
MGYRIKHGEGMADALRRIVAEEVDNAVAQLEGRGEDDRDAAVHDARKSLKKARSALRLVRYDLGNDVRSAENAVLRDAGRRLAGVRDAQVLLETLEKMSADERLPTPAEGVAQLRAELERRREELREQVHDSEGEAAAAVQELRELRARVAEWPLEDQGFASVARGLGRMADRGHDAMAEALSPHADDEAWHEWRKRVKDLWYALRILEPIAPRLLGGLVAEADELSDVLGDHNDLAVLAEAIDGHGDALHRAHAELLAAAVRRRADELRLQAIPLGARLYAEPSKALVRRIGTYWRALEAQAAADATWLAPEVAGRIREVLVAKRSAPDAAARRAATAELRSLGFRVSDFDGEVPRRRGGFAVRDFDALVASGRIRIGAPSPPGRERSSADERRRAEPAVRQEPAVAPAAGAEPGTYSPVELTRSALGLALDAARRASRMLSG